MLAQQPTASAIAPAISNGGEDGEGAGGFGGCPRPGLPAVSGIAIAPCQAEWPGPLRAWALVSSRGYDVCGRSPAALWAALPIDPLWALAREPMSFVSSRSPILTLGAPRSPGAHAGELPDLRMGTHLAPGLGVSPIPGAIPPAPGLAAPGAAPFYSQRSRAPVAPGPATGGTGA